jgi:hypothetical protein
MWNNELRLKYFGSAEDFSAEYCRQPSMQSGVKGTLERLNNVLSLNQFRLLAMSLTFYLPNAVHTSPQSQSEPLLKIGRNLKDGGIHRPGSCGFKAHNNNLYFWIVNKPYDFGVDGNDLWISYDEFMDRNDSNDGKLLYQNPINLGGLHQKDIMVALTKLSLYHETKEWIHGNKKLLVPADIEK